MLVSPSGSVSASLALTFALGALQVTPSFPALARNLAQTSGAAASQAAPLAVAEPMEDALGTGEADQYRFSLGAGQTAHLVAEQLGVDVTVSVSDPDGTVVAFADTPTGTVSREEVYVVSTRAGDYQVTVAALDPRSTGGRYRLTLRSVRAADPLDAQRDAAQKAYARGHDLISKYDPQLFSKALEEFERAMAAWRAAGDTAAEAYAQNRIAYVHELSEEFEKAEAGYTQALELHRKVGDRAGEAVSLGNLGFTRFARKDHRKAIEIYNACLAIKRELGDFDAQAATLTNLGEAYLALGEKERAVQAFAEALPIVRRAFTAGSVSYTLTNLANALEATGRYEEALAALAESLPLARAAGDRYWEAVTTSNRGMVFARLGRDEQAVDLLREAERIYEEEKDLRGQAIAVNNQAFILAEASRHREAIPLYRRALDLSQRAESPASSASILSNMGASYTALGRAGAALPPLRRSLELRRSVNDRYGEAVTLTRLGAAMLPLGRTSQALPILNSALELRRQLGDRAGEAHTLYTLARAERARGDLQAAKARIEEALAVVESIRGKITRPELRTSYFSTVQRYFDFYVDLMMRLHRRNPSAGFDKAAFEVSERARARTLLELLAEAGSLPASGAEAELLDRANELRQLIGDKAEIRLAMIAGGDADERIAAVTAEIDELSEQYDGVQAKLKESSTRYADLTVVSAPSVDAIQAEQIDGETAVVAYWLGVERSYAWVVGKNSFSAVALPRRAAIDALARAAYETLRGGRRGASNAAAPARQLARLSQTVVSRLPVPPDVRRLVVVPDGGLHLIPFGVLPASGRLAARPSPAAARGGAEPLLARFEIVNVPSAAALVSIRRVAEGRAPAPRLLAIFADPVFSRSDPRIRAAAPAESPAEAAPASTSTRELVLSGAAELERMRLADLQIGRLPWTRSEAEAIEALANGQRTLSALDFEANVDLATSGTLSEYRFVHFASHGILDAERPQLSAVVLSTLDDAGRARRGLLRLLDVYEMRLNADLVVLSACDTGLGREIRGEGFVGLTRGFMYAGAPRVLVSRWKVDDRSTAELMSRFYRNVLAAKMRPAEALRAAQLELREDPRWQHPYHWSGFTLEGDWR